MGDRGDPDTARADLEAIDAELERLGQLVEGLLALARSESATGTVVVDAAELAEDSGRPMEPTGRGAGRDAGAGRTAVSVRAIVAGGLEQVLDNLLDNALVVAPARQHGARWR